jgi:rod shape-determining protein MreB and related proteins
MLKFFVGQFSTTLYIQIWEDRIKVTDIKTGDTYDEQPLIAVKTTIKGQKVITAVGNNAVHAQSDNDTKVINPFSHPRTLLSDFEVGERLLKFIFKALFKNTILNPLPKVVIHPMEKIDGGLTMIEERAFKELAMSAGAYEAIVFIGKELSIPDFNYKTIKQSSESPIK